LGLAGWGWHRCLGRLGRHLAATFKHQLAGTTKGRGHGFFQQGQPALHHGHPVARHGDHRPPLIEPHQLGLLGEQHAGGGQFQARQDLLPQFAQVGFAPGVWAGFEGGFGAVFEGGFSSGVNGRRRRQGSALHCSALRGMGGDGPRNDGLSNDGLGRGSSGGGLELGFC
jgi:hypothetical protein